MHPTNTIAIAGDSIINAVFEDSYVEKTMWLRFEISQVRMWRICGITSYHLIFHAEKNDAKRFTSREILNQLLNLKKFVTEQVPACMVTISTQTVRSGDGKAGLTVSQLTNHLRQLKTGIVDNTNITSRHIEIKGLHLNFSGTTQFVKHYANVIKKIWMKKGCSYGYRKINWWIFSNEPIHYPGFTSPYRFHRTTDGGDILVYIREDIPSKLLNV